MRGIDFVLNADDDREPFYLFDTQDTGGIR